MIPDRLVGVLCLGVAATVATWGTGPSERADRATDGGVETVALAEPRPGEPSVPQDASTTTTTAPAGGPGAGASTTTTIMRAPSSTTTTTAPVNAEAEAAVAQRAVLAAADLPQGFTQSRPAPPGGSSEGPFERCLGSDAGTLTAAVRAKAGSPEFVRVDTGTVSTTAAVLDQPGSAEKVMGVLGSAPARSCFEGLINTRLARNPKLSEDVRGVISVLDAGTYGDQTTGFRFKVRLPAEDVEADPPEGEKEIPFVADFVFVRRGRVLVLFEFGSLRHPFPPAEVRTIATNVAAHI